MSHFKNRDLFHLLLGVSKTIIWVFMLKENTKRKDHPVPRVILLGIQGPGVSLEGEGARARAWAFSPVRLAKQPAEVGPGSPDHDSPYREGHLLGHCSHQLLHLLHHGPGICPIWEQGQVQGSPAWRQGCLRILLLDQGQEPAENQRCWSFRAPSSSPGFSSVC